MAEIPKMNMPENGGKNEGREVRRKDEIDELPDIADEGDETDELPDIADEGDEIDDLPDVDDEENFFAKGIEKTKALFKKIDEVFQIVGLDEEKHVERRDKVKDIVRYCNPVEMVKTVAYFSATSFVTNVNRFYKVINHYSSIDLDKTIVGDIKNIYDDVVTPQFVKDYFEDTWLDPQDVSEEMTELTCKAVDAALYIGGKAVVGAAGVIEDGVTFVVGTIADAAGHPEVAEKMYKSDITGAISDYMDEHYDGSELVKDIGACAEKVGEVGTYIGLGILAGSESAVVAVAATVATGVVKAGGATREAVEKTGEYTHKELAYGVVSGVMAVISQKVAGALHQGANNIEQSLVESTKSIKGKVAQYIVEKGIGTLVAAGEGAGGALLFDAQDVIKNYVAYILEIDDDVEVDYEKIAKDMGMGALTGGAIHLAVDILKDIRNYVGDGRNAEMKGVESGERDPREGQDEEIKRIESGEKELDSTKRKGNYGEMKTDQNLRESGYERIADDMISDIDAPGHQGIDGVYYNPDGHPPYMIVDAKYGTAQLADTLDGKQMSEGWIDQRLDASVGKEKADEIRMEKLLHPDHVGTYVSHIDENGNITFDKLDGNANIIERNVKINVKRLD